MLNLFPVVAVIASHFTLCSSFASCFSNKLSNKRTNSSGKESLIAFEQKKNLPKLSFQHCLQHALADTSTSLTSLTFAGCEWVCVSSL